MEETYEDIVRNWYEKLRPSFKSILMSRYGKNKLREEDAENIYQDVFIAIRSNLINGNLRQDTSWGSYILTIGMRMATKHILELKKEFEPEPEDDEPGLFNDPDVHSLLGDEITHTPEPCASIIKKTYYGNMSDRDIAEELEPYRSNGHSIEENAKAIKARRWLCMQDLIYRVKLALYHDGIIDEKPVKRRRGVRNLIELFEDQFLRHQSAAEVSDAEYALNYKVFRFIAYGFIREARAENIEFAASLAGLSEAQLFAIMGREHRPKVLRLPYLRERLSWAASVVAIMTIGIVAILGVRRSGMNRLDETIVAYNYIPESNRGWESVSASDIPSLEQAWLNAPADDIQAQQEAGMRLAMAYLKVHDRKKAKELLTELSTRFAADEDFAAQCTLILRLLK